MLAYDRKQFAMFSLCNTLDSLKLVAANNYLYMRIDTIYKVV